MASVAEEVAVVEVAAPAVQVELEEAVVQAMPAAVVVVESTVLPVAVPAIAPRSPDLAEHLRDHHPPH